VTAARDPVRNESAASDPTALKTPWLSGQTRSTAAA
jgi:hypothetical protein